MNDNSKKNLKMFSAEYQPKKNGRKKGQKNFRTIYKEFLKIKMTQKDLKELGIRLPPLSNGKEFTIQEAIILQHLRKTLRTANYKDLEIIMNRVDGLLKQKVESKETLTLSSEDAKIIAEEVLKNDKK